MTPKRPRISDNDPLNRTERVLQNFASTERPIERIESLTLEVTGKQVDKLKEPSTPDDVDTLTSQRVDNLAGQQDDQTIERAEDKQTDEVGPPQRVELKKATFQIDKAVLDRLEKFVLTLQLELGKENAPYKEVIVEEAIDRLITLDKTKLLKVLKKRQIRRK